MTERPLFLYKAFISHCDADKAVGDWLARSLQNYRVSRSIIGMDTHAGKISAALGPIFTRRADDGLRPLSTDVVNALFGAQFLIVIASRHCPESEQVNKEIRLFKSYHGESRILYLLMEDNAERRFPAAALFHVDADGALTNREAHPGQIVEGILGSDPVLQRVSAYLLGVTMEELAAARDRDRWKKRVKWGMVGAVLFLLCVRFLVPINLLDLPERMKPQKAPAPRALENETPEPEVMTPTFASTGKFSGNWPRIPMDFGQRPSLVWHTLAKSDWPISHHVSSTPRRRAKKSARHVR